MTTLHLHLTRTCRLLLYIWVGSTKVGNFTYFLGGKYYLAVDLFDSFGFRKSSKPVYYFNIKTDEFKFIKQEVSCPVIFPVTK